MKHKVGDKVRIREDLKENVYYGEYFAVSEAIRFGGKTVTISDIDMSKFSYEIEEDGGKFYWTDEMFDLAAKDLIQPGSVVECRSGEKFIYINGIFMHSDGWMFLGDGGLNDFSDDLVFLSGDKDFDIMRVFESKSTTLYNFFNHNCLTLVWERKETKEMTLEEIEKALGYPVKIVKGEENHGR